MNRLQRKTTLGPGRKRVLRHGEIKGEVEERAQSYLRDFAEGDPDRMNVNGGQ